MDATDDTSVMAALPRPRTVLRLFCLAWLGAAYTTGSAIELHRWWFAVVWGLITLSGFVIVDRLVIRTFP